MVVLYNTNRLGWNLVARYMIKTRTFSLPNLISEWQDAGRVVDEFCPHFGDADPIAQAVNELIKNPQARDRQIRGLEKVAQPFAGHQWGADAAQRVLKVAGL